MQHKWHYANVGLLTFDDETKELTLANSKPHKAEDLFNGKYNDHWLWLVKDLVVAIDGKTRFFTVGCSETPMACSDPRCQEHICHVPSY